jgi:fermentation-respiration switch protein FrsA (DUF1100 family)
MGDDASVFRTTVRIPTASGDDLEARVYQPEGHGPHTAVVMAHEFAGVKEGSRSRSASGAKGSRPLLSTTAIGAARVASLAK